jgi:signal transduction histidine kinase/pSer/pThr/pTyr-binding forkhead associated (FHA) protein
VPRLIVIKGADEGKQFELHGSELFIGREATSQVRLHDTEATRRHAVLRQVEGGYSLVDVGSLNGTEVNYQRVTERVLQSGDHIRIGNTVLVYSAGRADPQVASDLAERISMIARQEGDDLSSAIVKTVGEAEGSRILAQPQQASTAWLQSALANLGVMYEAIHSVSHILDLDQLLEKIMDLIFRSIEADRGCIMLRNSDTGGFEPKAARWRNKLPSGEKLAISRTIMDYVLRERQGVLVSDAARDERFSAGQSIVRFGIREAICVPMKGRHETLGVLYLDTQTSTRELVAHDSATGKFTEDHLKLAIAIAHQAALAVEDTRYHQAMLQAERLAAIGQTVAALSHHIKNILQGLRSGSEILKMGLGDKNEALLQQGWRIVEKNQAKIYDLVMEMLTYSKEREPAIEDTDLNRLVGEVLELAQGRAKELGAQLETRLAVHVPPVPADPEGLHRALLNIVSNALDAVEERKNPKVVVATMLESNAEWARIVVLDNGPGIPQHKLADIFKPFVSTKGSKGTGLGLAVSRKILREHGGDILVQSQLGKGTRFILRLPLRSPLGVDAAGTGSEMPTFRPPAE